MLETMKEIVRFQHVLRCFFLLWRINRVKRVLLFPWNYVYSTFNDNCSYIVCYFLDLFKNAYEWSIYRLIDWYLVKPRNKTKHGYAYDSFVEESSSDSEGI